MGVGVGVGVVMGGPKIKKNKKKQDTIQAKTGAQLNKTLLTKSLPVPSYKPIIVHFIRHSTIIKQSLDPNINSILKDYGK